LQQIKNPENDNAGPEVNGCDWIMLSSGKWRRVVYRISICLLNHDNGWWPRTAEQKFIHLKPLVSKLREATSCTEYELSQFSENVSYILDKKFFYPEDVSSRFLRQIGACLLDSTLSHPRRQYYSNYETHVNSLHNYWNPRRHFNI